MKYITLFIVILLTLSFAGISQRITYSEPERDDARSMDFDIIGKVSGNFLVYKGLRGNHMIAVYDNEMKLKEKHDLSFLPDRIVDADFIAYSDFSYMIYEFQKHGTLHCMAVKLDSIGNKIGEPKELDTTSIGLLADNKIYNVIYSEDRQKIVVFKIQRKNDKFYYTTLLFNQQLELQKKSRMLMTYEERKNALSDFSVDNDGNFVFALGHKSGIRDYINDVSLILKEPFTDSFSIHEISISKVYLDELQLKVDNVNKHFLINSLYYAKKRGDIEGIFSAIWDRQENKQVVENAVAFNDTLKRDAKTDGPTRAAFNNFFIKNIIVKRDGGFILSCEDYYTSSKTNPWNRMDYLYGYPYSGADYYYPSYYNSYRWRNYYNSSNNMLTRYYYDNIVAFNMDKSGNLIWSNVIHKSQYDDDTDNFLSYQLFNAGNQLHFLFNEKDRRNQVLSDRTLQPDGELLRNPTLKSLDKGYEFMPRLGKQVSSRQVIVPCYYRNYLCFAKIDY
jgi:hypothetical protein